MTDPAKRFKQHALGHAARLLWAKLAPPPSLRTLQHATPRAIVTRRLALQPWPQPALQGTPLQPRTLRATLRTLQLTPLKLKRLKQDASASAVADLARLVYDAGNVVLLPAGEPRVAFVLFQSYHEISWILQRTIRFAAGVYSACAASVSFSFRTAFAGVRLGAALRGSRQKRA